MWVVTWVMYPDAELACASWLLCKLACASWLLCKLACVHFPSSSG